ncbi:NTP transferase domain-containing protein [Maribacter algicola]|uniref:NTP transferase domain-containing protein n=1 Tax=Meishania litoralis TaxID=3434685 RepID=A0ACC7LLE1_9FLAO
MKSNVAILILAAGESSRMGSAKQLLPWNNTTLLGHAMETAKKTASKDVFVVLGANSEEIRNTISNADVHILENKNWAKGMGVSVATGIAYILKEHESLDGVLIMLCDQPLISSDYLNRLLKIFEVGNYGIIATKYGKKNGVPAIFDKKYFSMLSRLNGDTGAKHVLDWYRGDTRVMDPGGKEQDLDTPEDYEKLFQAD